MTSYCRVPSAFKFQYSWHT